MKQLEDETRERKRRDPRRVFAEPPVVAEGTVTAIVELPRVRGRYGIAIDGRGAVTLSAAVIADLGIGVGSPVDNALAFRLGDAALRLAVFDKAVALLAVSARSTRDLRLRLKRVGAREEDIEAAIGRLSDLGPVNDAEYARNLVRSRVVGGGVSRRRIKTELYRRGVPAEVADEAIADTLEEIDLDEYGAALGVGQKRIRSLASLDPVTRRRRLYSFLARRGYDLEVVSRVMRELLKERDSD